jgi:hypothetical protein
VQISEWLQVYADHGIIFSQMHLKGLQQIAYTVTPQDRSIRGAIEAWAESMLYVLGGAHPTRRSSPEVFAVADLLDIDLQKIIQKVEDMHEHGDVVQSRLAAAEKTSSSQDLYDKWSAELTQKRIRITPLIQRGLEAMSYFGEKEGVLKPADAIEFWVDTMVRTSQEISRQKHAGIYALANALGIDIDLEIEDAKSYSKSASANKPKVKPQVVQAPKQRDPNAEAMANKRNRGDGAHQNRTHDVERGRSRTEKHRTDWRDKEASVATMTQSRGQFTINQDFLDLLLQKYAGAKVGGQYSVNAGRYSLLITPTVKGDYTIEGAPAEMLIKAAQFLGAQFVQKL